jgi:hypothetical protein
MHRSLYYVRAVRKVSRRAIRIDGYPAPSPTVGLVSALPATRKTAATVDNVYGLAVRAINSADRLLTLGQGRLSLA